MKLSGFYQLELTCDRIKTLSITEIDDISQGGQDRLVNLGTEKTLYSPYLPRWHLLELVQSFSLLLLLRLRSPLFSGASLYALSISLLSLSFESKSLNRFLDFFFFVTKYKWNLINHLQTLLLRTKVSPNNIKWKKIVHTI